MEWTIALGFLTIANLHGVMISKKAKKINWCIISVFTAGACFVSFIESIN